MYNLAVPSHGIEFTVELDSLLSSQPIICLTHVLLNPWS